jgi:hypothetical protein
MVQKFKLTALQIFGQHSIYTWEVKLEHKNHTLARYSLREYTIRILGTF